MSKGFHPDQEFSRRMLMAGVGGGVVWAGLVARLFQLQILEGKKYDKLANENHIKLELAPPQRGRILDRFGKPLASPRRAGRVTVIPEQLDDPAATIASIGRLIELSDGQVERVLRDIQRARLRRAAFLPVIVANELSYEDFARMNVHAVELPGVQVEMALTRSYPRGRDFAHVLGYVARASQDDLDRLTNAAGRVIDQIPNERLAPEAGKDLFITIDMDLQRVAIERFQGESGAAVVVDIDSGEILSMVSTPAFDPNDFVNGISSADYAALRDNTRSPLYPRAHGGVYPPGSTFKMVVATAALETGAITPSDKVHCNGYYHFGNRTWHCWKKGGHGTVDLHGGIKGSCDVYFYEVARRAGAQAIADTARKFGFGQAWTLGMTGARGGLVPDPEWKRRVRKEPWYEGETLNFGIGQGQLGVTPLQLALMTARIATEGHALKPSLIGLGPKDPDEHVLDAHLDAEIMKLMKSGMYGVTSEWGGTARSSGDLGLGGPRLAGKTGTAQVRRITTAERATGVRKGANIERELRDHALFVAYAPAENPKYAISVVVEHGEGGSRTAAPVARDILAHAIRTNSGRKPAWTKSASINRSDEEGTPT